MRRHVCISCGNSIMKSAREDPYMCRDCDMLLAGKELSERYGYLDNY